VPREVAAAGVEDFVIIAHIDGFWYAKDRGGGIEILEEMVDAREETRQSWRSLERTKPSTKMLED
jgi:hypothetical protein